MFGGSVVSLLLFGITWVQVKARLQAQHDMRELRLSKAALAADKELLGITLNSIADGVITTDTAGRIISVNKAVESLTGWPQNEAEGSQSSDVFRAIRDRYPNPLSQPR